MASVSAQKVAGGLGPTARLAAMARGGRRGAQQGGRGSGSSTSTSGGRGAGRGQSLDAIVLICKIHVTLAFAQSTFMCDSGKHCCTSSSTRR